MPFLTGAATFGSELGRRSRRRTCRLPLTSVMAAAFLPPPAGCSRLAAVRLAPAPRRQPSRVPLAAPAAPSPRRCTLVATAATPSPPTPSSTSDTSGAVTAASTPGTFTFSPDRDVSVGDTLTVTYTPPAGLFTPDDVVCYAGGFNGWSSETDTSPLLFPAQSLLDGRYRVAVVVPNFARVLDFAFVQDAAAGGVRYDDNGGALFHIGVVNQLRLTPDGEVQSYVANKDGSAVDAGADGAGGDGDGGGGRGVDLAGGGGVGGVGMEPVLDEGAEAALHRSRGESAAVGEAAGLGNIQISAARDAFERQDPAMTGVLSVAAAVRALVILGFEMDERRLRELRSTVGAGGGDDLHMSDFVRVYADLENADEGIDIL